MAKSTVEVKPRFHPISETVVMTVDFDKCQLRGCVYFSISLDQSFFEESLYTDHVSRLYPLAHIYSLQLQ